MKYDPGKPGYQYANDLSIDDVAALVKAASDGQKMHKVAALIDKMLMNSAKQANSRGKYWELLHSSYSPFSFQYHIFEAERYIFTVYGYPLRSDMMVISTVDHTLNKHTLYCFYEGDETPAGSTIEAVTAVTASRAVEIVRAQLLLAIVH